MAGPGGSCGDETLRESDEMQEAAGAHPPITRSTAAAAAGRLCQSPEPSSNDPPSSPSRAHAEKKRSICADASGPDGSV